MIKNVVRLEHVNLNIGEAAESFESSFYFHRDILGMTCDPEQAGSRTTWWNINTNHQIHTPRQMPIQCIQGEKGCLTLASPFFSKERLVEDPVTHSRLKLLPRPPGTQGYLIGATIGCPPDSIPHIAAFWEKYLGADVSLKDKTLVTVTVGPSQKLRFYADSTVTLQSYTGWHLCIYITHFQETYVKMKKAGLIFTNHRFSDKCRTLDEAVDGHQFRAKDVKDSKGKLVFELELEVRSVSHPAFYANRYTRKYKE